MATIEVSQEVKRVWVEGRIFRRNPSRIYDEGEQQAIARLQQLLGDTDNVEAIQAIKHQLRALDVQVIELGTLASSDEGSLTVGNQSTLLQRVARIIRRLR